MSLPDSIEEEIANSGIKSYKGMVDYANELYARYGFIEEERRKHEEASDKNDE